MDNIDFEAMSSYDKVRKLYFSVSVRTNNNRNIWGRVYQSQMNLSSYGKIAERNIDTLNTVHDAIHVEKYIVMPNHIHLIISILKSGFSYIPTEEKLREFIGELIEDYKIRTTNDIIDFLANASSMGIPAESDTDFWHKGCHIRGIGNMYEYKKASHHIRDNAADWTNDRYYTD